MSDDSPFLRPREDGPFVRAVRRAAEKAALNVSTEAERKEREEKQRAAMAKARAVADKVVTKVKATEKAVLPKVLHEPIDKLDDFLSGEYSRRARERWIDKEAKLKGIEEGIRRVQKIKDAQDGIRQPIQMSREFSSEEDKEKYIRQKMKEAARRTTK